MCTYPHHIPLVLNNVPTIVHISTSHIHSAPSCDNNIQKPQSQITSASYWARQCAHIHITCHLCSIICQTVCTYSHHISVVLHNVHISQVNQAPILGIDGVTITSFSSILLVRTRPALYKTRSGDLVMPDPFWLYFRWNLDHIRSYYTILDNFRTIVYHFGSFKTNFNHVLHVIYKMI